MNPCVTCLFFLTFLYVFSTRFKYLNGYLFFSCCYVDQKVIEPCRWKALYNGNETTANKTFVILINDDREYNNKLVILSHPSRGSLWPAGMCPSTWKNRHRRKERKEALASEIEEDNNKKKWFLLLGNEKINEEEEETSAQNNADGSCCCGMIWRLRRRPGVYSLDQ